MDSTVKRENGQGIGALLKASRLRCGEDLQDVASILCVRRCYLEAIEEGRFGELPGSTYAIGFIRAYADHLGLDSKEVVRRFKSSDAQPVRAAKQELSFPVPVAESGVPGGAIVFVGALVAVVAYGAWYLSTTKDGFFAELIAPLPERLVSLANAPPTPTQGTNQSENEKAAPSPTVATAATLPDRQAETTPAAASVPLTAKVEPVEVVRLADPAPVSTGTTGEPTPNGGESAPATPTAAAGPARSTEPAKTEKAEMTEKADSVTTSANAETAEPTSVTATVEKDIEKAEAATRVQASTPASEFAGMPAAEATRALPAPPPAVDAEANPPVAATEVAARPLPPTKPVVEAAPDRNRTEVAALTAPSRDVDAPYRPAVKPDAPAPAAEPVEKPAPILASRTAAAPDAKPEEGPRGSRIVVKAKSNSWIQVRDDVGNQLLLTRLLRAGDTYPVPNRPGLKLLTGNAGALEILVDGQAVPAIGGGAIRRSVALDVQRLRQGTAIVD